MGECDEIEPCKQAYLFCFQCKKENYLYYVLWIFIYGFAEIMLVVKG